MKKLSILLLCLSFGAVLSGCGGSSDANELVSFADQYQFSIPEGFESLNTKLVENKQITNRVLLSYKKDNEDIFDDNVVVTVSEIGPSLDYEQFRSVNSKKLQTSLAGYVPGKQKNVSFECGSDEVKGIFVTFDVKNSFSNVQELTYLSQMQFVHEEKGYIASFAGVNKKDRDRSEKRLSKISCI